MWLALALALAADPPRRATFDLELQDADVHVALRLVADAGDVDFVVDDRVTGAVNLHLRRVTWDEALAAILAQKGLVAVPAGATTWEVRPAK